MELRPVCPVLTWYNLLIVPRRQVTSRSFERDSLEASLSLCQINMKSYYLHYLTYYITIALLIAWRPSSISSGFTWRPVKHEYPRTLLYMTSEQLPTSRYNLSIEYCTGCRWMLRAIWTAQELFTTFENELTSITLVPSKPPSPGGVFQVVLNNQLLWDRKTDGGFPESKQLKQKVRDMISPDKDLGHSDVVVVVVKPVPIVHMDDAPTKTVVDDCQECNREEDNQFGTLTSKTIQTTTTTHKSPNLCISYPNRTYMFRSAWLAQEILTYMQEEIGSVTLFPSRIENDEISILLNGAVLLKWRHVTNQGFFELSELQDKLNFCLRAGEEQNGFDESDEAEAEQMRRFFGVA